MPVHLSAGGLFRLVCYSFGWSRGVYDVLFRDYDPLMKTSVFEAFLQRRQTCFLTPPQNPNCDADSWRQPDQNFRNVLRSRLTGEAYKRDLARLARNTQYA